MNEHMSISWSYAVMILSAAAVFVITSVYWCVTGVCELVGIVGKTYWLGVGLEGKERCYITRFWDFTAIELLLKCPLRRLECDTA